MDYNERSNVNPNHLTSGQVGLAVMNYLQKHYKEGEHFSMSKLRRALTGIPSRKIGGHISRLSREKFIKQNPTSHDDYTLLKNIKDYKKKNFDTIPVGTLENLDLGEQPVLQIAGNLPEETATETIIPPVETMTVEAIKTASEANNTPHAATHASEPKKSSEAIAEAIEADMQSVSEVSGQSLTAMILSEKLLEVAAQLSDMKPDLSKATSQELIDELQRRLISNQ